MSKITYENKKGKITITNHLTYPEAVNERVYNALSSGMFEGFLPITVIQKRKETRLECRIQELVLASHFLGGTVSKRVFLDFVLQIIDVIKNCDRNMINADNVELSMDKIFIDTRTNKVHCIFWPIVNNQRENLTHLFFRQLPNTLSFNIQEDLGYLRRYQEFFDSSTPFSIKTFEKFVLKIKGEKISEGPSCEEEKHECFSWCSEEQNSFKRQNGAHSTKEILRTVIYCPSCGEANEQDANFCGICGMNIRKKHTSSLSNATTVLGEEADITAVLDEDDFGTTVLFYEEPEEPTYPILHQVRTDEEFIIDVDVFRIGKKSGECDCVISDNQYISKHHADIITRLERYYVIDRGSTNKTFVDGKKIEPNTEVELFHGTSISFANEEFIFNIEE